MFLRNQPGLQEWSIVRDKYLILTKYEYKWFVFLENKMTRYKDT